MFFSEAHIQILARGILQPGEQLVATTVTDYMPWWAFGLIRRQHLVFATDQRIVILDHRYDILKVNQVLFAVESLPWGSVQHAKVTGLFKKKLKVRGMNETGRAVDISAKIPKSFLPWALPLKNNFDGAKNVAAAFVTRSNGPALGYSPPGQLGAAPYSQPPVNAPGYQSAPPGPYGAPPPPQAPFAPPRQY